MATKAVRWGATSRPVAPGTGGLRSPATRPASRRHTGPTSGRSDCGERPVRLNQNSEGAAGTPIFAAIDGELCALLILADPLRPEAAGVVQALRGRGVKEIVMLTGEHPAVAERVAHEVGIEHYVAEALPDQKAELVRTLQAALLGPPSSATVRPSSLRSMRSGLCRTARH